LRAILQNAGRLSVKDDTPRCLAAGCIPHNAAAHRLGERQKAYVSYHLMPVYGCPIAAGCSRS
jgi:hypothetical protein